jgi:Cu-Zn family superoxide dismutase
MRNYLRITCSRTNYQEEKDLRIVAIVVMVVVAIAAYVGLVPGVLAADPPYGGTAVQSVTATLVDPAGKQLGTVQLHQDAAGVVLVRVDAARIPAGAHGMHIHQTGRCEGPAFASAGGHFNPTNKKHGLDSPDGAHGGDLTQIPATFDGSGVHEATTARISLTGGVTALNDADGSSLIIHAGPDDQVTDPTGNSGGRIACAVLAAPTAAPLPPATGTGLAPESGGRFAVFAGFAIIAAALALAGVRIARRSGGQSA